MKQYLATLLLFLALDATGAKALALKTWGVDGRAWQEFVYIPAQEIWGVRFCVGKQEYYPATTVTPFGYLPNPNAGKPIMVNGKETPTKLGCGSDWNSAYTDAKVPLP